MNSSKTLRSVPKATQNLIPLVAGFLMLALTYHAAEYMMRFHQNIPAFLGLMLMVVMVAYGVAKWQGFEGLSAWGLRVNSKTLSWLVIGLIVGLLFYIVAFLLRLWLQMEFITAVPDLSTGVTTTLIFTMGTFLPSLAEDILTRGYLFRHLNNKVSNLSFILISSIVYVLNHIYALGNGPSQLIFLFVLGLVLALPLVNTKSLWYTVGIHWAGNIVYRFSNDVISLEKGSNPFPALWELTFFLLLLLLFNQFLTKRIGRRSQVTDKAQQLTAFE